MNEITQHLDGEPSSSSSSSTKRYILNVNFAGNDMYESYIRVILETEGNYTDLMELYLECESRGIDDLSHTYAWCDKHPPPCLFYYGYLAWVKI
jgi:hypothetical protein